MSLEINIENFPNLSSVLEEIERKRGREPVSRPKPKAPKSLEKEEKLRSSAMLEPQTPKRSNSARRRTSDLTSDTHRASDPVIDRAKVQGDSRLAEASKQLSDKELALLYADILKPLDFYAKLNERRKTW